MNLLPQTEKENIKKGFRRRFVVVVLLLIVASLAISTVLLVPAYIFAQARFAEITAESDFVKHQSEASVVDVANVPTEINTKLKVFQDIVNRKTFIESANDLINIKPLDVIVESISYGRNLELGGKGATKIQLSGIAGDRKSLITYTANLKESGKFSQVDVPVSNLTKDKNVPFSMTLYIEK